jgi:hypothetical protein
MVDVSGVTDQTSALDVVIQLSLSLLAAGAIAWGWSPLTSWLARRSMKIELLPRSSWWIAFAPFAAWCLTSNVLRFLLATQWISVVSGLVAALGVAPLIARPILSRAVGHEVSLIRVAGLTLGTFCVPFGLVALGLTIAGLVARTHG